MSTIKIYDSRESLSNYEIGNVYSFYMHNTNLNRLVRVKEEDFKNHIQTLNNEISSNKTLIQNDSQCLNLSRAIGVVIDKHEKHSPNSVDQITVLFKTTTNEYVLNKYVVNSHNVHTNEKNYVMPGAMINVAL